MMRDGHGTSQGPASPMSTSQLGPMESLYLAMADLSRPHPVASPKGDTSVRLSTGSSNTQSLLDTLKPGGPGMRHSNSDTMLSSLELSFSAVDRRHSDVLPEIDDLLARAAALKEPCHVSPHARRKAATAPPEVELNTTAPFQPDRTLPPMEVRNSGSSQRSGASSCNSKAQMQDLMLGAARLFQPYVGSHKRRRLSQWVQTQLTDFERSATTYPGASMSEHPGQSTTSYVPFAVNRSALRETDEEGNDTVNDYVMWQELGHGAAGTVYLALDTQADDVRAIKVIPRSRLPRSRPLTGLASMTTDDGVGSLLVEVAVMKKLRHPHIVALHEFIDDPSARDVFLVMQYVPDGPIVRVDNDGCCEPLPVKLVATYTKQLGQALAYTHRKGIVHGDIKPDNILVDRRDEAHPKAFLADFGVSHKILGRWADGLRQEKEKLLLAPRMLFGVSATSPAALFASPHSVHSAHSQGASTEGGLGAPGLGTPLFLAPEVLNGAPPGPPADMWAFGVTVYCCIFGQLPFVGATLADLTHVVNYEPVHFPASESHTRKWQGLLVRLLDKDPKTRMTARELLRARMLRDPDTLDKDESFVASMMLSTKELPEDEEEDEEEDSPMGSPPQITVTAEDCRTALTKKLSIVVTGPLAQNPPPPRAPGSSSSVLSVSSGDDSVLLE